MNNENSAAFNLGVTRFAFYTLAFYLLEYHATHLDWTRVPSEFWRPMGLFRLFDGPDELRIWQVWLSNIWVYTTPFCAAGLFFRILGPINFIAVFFAMNYTHSFGYLPHTQMPILLATLPLAFSRASDRFSFDQFLFPHRVKVASDKENYERPLKTMQIVLVLVYFAAGIAKLREGGLEWITTDSLRNRFANASFRFAGLNLLSHQLQVNQWLYDFPMLCRILAALTVFIETSAPILLLRRRWTWIYLPLLLAMQIAIYFTMFVNFQSYLALYVAWIDWSWLHSKFKRFRHGDSHHP